MTGHLFNIQRFSLDDGPGIRTVVFLKGCNQSCPWCHNPESLSPLPQMLRRQSLCARCGLCARACPAGAVSRGEEGFFTDHQKCTRCGACAAQCPAGALLPVGYDRTPQEVLAAVKKDLAFYRRSGGGVTFSGGEPAMQPEFLLECLRACREAGIHTAVETNGNFPLSLAERLSPLLDYVMADLKHTDDAKHLRFTGASNRRSLDSARYFLARNDTDLRVPVVPGFNDTAEELQGILDFARENGAKHVTLLPYHTFGIGKYRNLGMSYALGAEPLPAQAVRALAGTLDAAGLTVEVHER